MPVYERESQLPLPVDEVLAWHERPGALERLTPPWQRVEVLEQSGGVAPGGRATLRLRQGPLAVRWTAAHHALPDAGRGFLDVQERGPFRAWRHEHRFEADGAGGTRALDRVTYALPAGALGDAVAGRMVRRQLDRAFAHRHRQLALDLARHARFAAAGPQRVAVTGASGLLGTHLAPFLTTGGHEVRPLVRREPRGPHEVRWGPAARTIERAKLEGMDAVVHLAGENIGESRWTEARKRRILESRREGTRLLAETLASLDAPPRVLVSASAVGIYGDRGDEVLTERSALGDGFLADVCRAWESATEPARAAGIRVVHLRFGVVLSAHGGALQRLLLPTRLGAGGPIGGGRQWLSWVHLDDAIGAIHHAMLSPDLRGPVNVVAPEPVRQRDFAKALGRVLHRPAVAPLPALAVRALFGEMGESVLLESQRVVPTALAASGFVHGRPELGDALRTETGG